MYARVRGYKAMGASVITYSYLRGIGKKVNGRQERMKER
jgi:hypothetical protein